MANKPLGRIRKSFEYKQLRLTGKKYFPVEWMLLNYSKSDSDRCHVGWTIPSKIGTAVLRNKMKRWIREFFLQQFKQRKDTRVDKSVDKGVNINVVVIQRAGKTYSQITHAEFKSALEKGWRHVQRMHAH